MLQSVIILQIWYPINFPDTGRCKYCMRAQVILSGSHCTINPPIYFASPKDHFASEYLPYISPRQDISFIRSSPSLCVQHKGAANNFKRAGGKSAKELIGSSGISRQPVE